MSLARIIWSISLLAAIVLSFVATPYAGMILAILGLICGWFVDNEHRSGLLIAAIFLIAGGTAWGAIPVVGSYLSAIFENYAGVLSAGALTAICRTTAERLFLNKGTSD